MMRTSTPIGLALTLIAGFMSGNCMLPTKFVRTWKWENVWAIFSVVSLILLPWALALVLVKDLGQVYRTLTLAQIAAPLALGAGWGIAQVLFGISVKRLGLGVAYAIIVGLGAVLGTLVPLFVGQISSLNRFSLSAILAGVLLMILGIALTAWGGHLREQNTKDNRSSFQSKGYPAAILIAVLCGFMAPMLNYSFAFGQDIARQAVHFGNAPLFAAYAVWPIGLTGGFIPNAVYCIYLLSRNSSWSTFQESHPDALWSLLMGVLWMGAFSLYGMSAVFLGSRGTSIGWGLLQIFMIATATLSGVLTGEWRSASFRAITFLGIGLTVLIIATLLFTWSNYL
jgi:L-rhamnose-H+ transport protein